MRTSKLRSRLPFDGAQLHPVHLDHGSVTTVNSNRERALASVQAGNKPITTPPRRAYSTALLHHGKRSEYGGFIQTVPDQSCFRASCFLVKCAGHNASSSVAATSKVQFPPKASEDAFRCSALIAPGIRTGIGSVPFAWRTLEPIQAGFPAIKTPFVKTSGEDGHAVLEVLHQLIRAGTINPDPPSEANETITPQLVMLPGGVKPFGLGARAHPWSPA
jgi:hypothetical protein